MASRRAILMVAVLSVWLAACGGPMDHHEWYVAPSAATRPPAQLTAWTTINEVPDWQAKMLIDSAEAHNATGGNVALTIEGEAVDNNVYRERVAVAAEQGTAPDIAFIDDLGHFTRLIDAGYVWPLDDCRQSHPGLAGIRDEAWTAVMSGEQTWAIPISLNIRHLFYNKEMLHALGWPAERIDALPTAIREGRFTFDDLMATAREAIDAGLVAPGYGYWHYLANPVTQYYRALGGHTHDPESGKLLLDREILAETYRLIAGLADEGITLPFVLDTRRNSWSGRLAWHDAVVEERLLFWLARSGDWLRWEMGTTEPGVLLDRFGYALVPSALPDEPGVVYPTWTGFAVMSEKATGRDHQAEACAVLAHMADPAIAALAMRAQHFPVLEEEIPVEISPATAYTANAQYIGDYALQSVIMNDVRMNRYNTILTDPFDRVMTGDLTIDEAVAAAVAAAKLEFGDEVIVR